MGLEQLLGGLLFVSGGLFLPVDSKIAFVLFATLFCGLPFILAGLMIWEIHERLPFMRRVQGVSWHAVAQRWPTLSDVMGRIAGSLLVTAMAVVAWAVVFYPGRESMSDPRVGRVVFTVGALVTTAVAVAAWIRVAKHRARNKP